MVVNKAQKKDRMNKLMAFFCFRSFCFFFRELNFLPLFFALPIPEAIVGKVLWVSGFGFLNGISVEKVAPKTAAPKAL